MITMREFKKSVRVLNNLLSDVSGDDVLSYVGLQRKHSTIDYLLPALGLLGVGVAIGVGVGIAVAPKAGSDLRNDIKDDLKQKVNSLRDKVNHSQNAMSTLSTTHDTGSI